MQDKDNARKEDARKGQCKERTMLSLHCLFFALPIPCIFLSLHFPSLQCPFLALSFLALSFPCIFLPCIVLSLHFPFLALSFPCNVLSLQCPFLAMSFPCIVLGLVCNTPYQCRRFYATNDCIFFCSDTCLFIFNTSDLRI